MIKVKVPDIHQPQTYCGKVRQNMTENEESLINSINELKKKIANLENMNKASLEVIQRLAKAIDKVTNTNKVDHFAIQVIAKELKIESEVYGRITQRGYRFEREPFL